MVILDVSKCEHLELVRKTSPFFGPAFVKLAAGNLVKCYTYTVNIIFYFYFDNYHVAQLIGP